ncbi:SAM hydrolase/SAM-dependent halogenase family protein [Psychroflexus aestuariivivens]|uniref:SAM hydrolase/SAM-dependent halogenase family protein n=1 Tax=Psychroflexus aestuariivivens TaxID=1795040 RepID=UPI000FD9C2BF|nr:SAM-dependent chlorinase/fluorinase [Psychroflexus aestuariivivens]
MPIITLTTDFGTKDHSVAAVKGAIYSELDQVNIVDVSHDISPFNYTEAAYIIKNAYHNFPKNSIHIIGIDSELTPENKHLAIYLDGHYFICANNGILSLIASEIKPDKIVEINIHNSIETNFTVLDVFVNVAAHISRGGALEVIGRNIDEIYQLKNIQPIVNQNKDQIIGHVIYIDNFGNVVSNINKRDFQYLRKGRDFTIKARSTKFSKIFDSYSEAINFDIPKENREMEGKKLALFNASKYLELAIYKSNPMSVGSASTLFGLKYMDTITVNFL